jgi:DNA invertase Pin-like site-specific DNA recombinase
MSHSLPSPLQHVDDGLGSIAGNPAIAARAPKALDRVSRDQEDVAGVFKRLRFAGVTIVTLSEGEINELHVGLKGTITALFLKDLAIKTHCGIRGRVEAGKIGGGNAYGHRVVHRLDAHGEPVPGEREIIEERPKSCGASSATVSPAKGRATSLPT